MKKSIVFIVVGALLGLGAAVTFGVQSAFPLSEFSEMGFSMLQYYPLTDYLAYGLAVMSVLLMLVGAFLYWKPYYLVTVKSTVLASVACFLCVCIVCGGAFALGVTKPLVFNRYNVYVPEIDDYEYNKAIPAEYLNILPFYDREKGKNDDNVTFFKVDIPYASYIHSQYFPVVENDEFMCDVEFFEASRNSLLERYKSVKNQPYQEKDKVLSYLEAENKSVNGTDYAVYYGDTYCEVRVITGEHYFSFVINAAQLLNSKIDAEKTALETYKKILEFYETEDKNVIPLYQDYLSVG